MRKLMLTMTVLVTMLLAACSSSPAVADVSSDVSAVVTTTTTAAPEKDDTTSDSQTPEETRDELLSDLFEMLENYDGPTGPLYGDTGDCNPLFSNCLYDPLYGSCEWDYWRGVYTCDSYHYRPGYDCAYDWWWGEYTCRPGDGYGGLGSTWGW